MSEPIHIVCPHCDAINRVPREKLGVQPKCGKCSTPLFSGQPLGLNELRFARHIHKNDLPVLVDFWAPWCGPCKMMAPAFEEAARRLEPNLRLVKVSTEENQGIAAQLNIRSIPTLALFRQGREVARVAGAMDAPRLVDWVKQNL
ncbi:thioredoxin TrxC [Solemya velesiana gill symbiont]|uniref:Thioredoxin n=1 Tax=Solemya velesiana gill symbiont TaxID=1918948 RepID=A0A1T2KSH9_9GAMM|nr:thioredoxin TrxC [Solemya velesiana gill symbiont]OOZ35815.1 thioredoxin [Solemya velesiana gill symbiont]